MTDPTSPGPPPAPRPGAAPAGAAPAGAAATGTGAAAPASAWSPFRYRAFTLLWTATLVSNIGTWMNDVGSGWLMTVLSPSPAVVALVQSATTAPVFLFALLAGALADRIDRRRYLVAVNAIVAVVIAVLALVTSLGLMTPLLLLVFTFAIGTGAAFVAPAWQAVVPGLVPRGALQPAIALNSMGINISRAIGPALAGVLITAVGLSAPFIANAVSTVVIVVALLAWRPAPEPARTLPPEPILGAMLTGLRHAARNPALRATMLRSFGFFTFASAYWALLPLVARSLPGGGAELYGVLLAAVGAGAVSGALSLPWLRRKVDSNLLAALGTGVTALGMVLLGLAGNTPVALLAAVLGGLGWIAVLTSLNVSAQTALPDWVRARGLAVTLMVFFGCMSAGAAIWGQVAAAGSIRMALLIAAAGALVAIPLTWRAKLGQGEALDLSPALGWADPVIDPELGESHDRGPVLVTIRYEVPAELTEGFLAAIGTLSGERYRNGAHDWGVSQDAADPRIWLEWFFLPSWVEHLRHHARTTRDEQEVHASVRAFHRGTQAPEVRHYLAPERRKAGRHPHSRAGAAPAP
ncbi:MFS transporter [Paroceanicella profunda]|uniref:MFS transporter n=1 Tax=Paroceanicella profunda TaxID=2579971 RepID=A0A5B8FVR2_9RHOB|nr:MFS transporter [Paroceanicella profunda]QDL90422.1 MFS transporter [Paroceanicella profunda]